MSRNRKRGPKATSEPGTWRLIHAFMWLIPTYFGFSLIFFLIGMSPLVSWLPASGVTCWLAIRHARWHRRIDKESKERP